MIIPISTDAPIYYWPWMTLVLIGVNVIVFLATGFGGQSDGWQISYGQGLHPLEWVAYNFFHCKQNWVDCENWDLFAVLKGTHGNRARIGGTV